MTWLLAERRCDQRQTRRKYRRERGGARTIELPSLRAEGNLRSANCLQCAPPSVGSFCISRSGGAFRHIPPHPRHRVTDGGFVLRARCHPEGIGSDVRDLGIERPAPPQDPSSAPPPRDDTSWKHALQPPTEPPFASDSPSVGSFCAPAHRMPRWVRFVKERHN